MKSVICRKCQLKFKLTEENANALGGTLMYHIMTDHPELKEGLIRKFMDLLTEYFIFEDYEDRYLFR